MDQRELNSNPNLSLNLKQSIILQYGSFLHLPFMKINSLGFDPQESLTFLCYDPNQSINFDRGGSVVVLHELFFQVKCILRTYPELQRVGFFLILTHSKSQHFLCEVHFALRKNSFKHL